MKTSSGNPSIATQSLTQLWLPVNGFQLHWRFWEEQYVVYNGGSGHTHILDPVAALILQEVLEKAVGTDELIDRIVSMLGLVPTKEVRENLEQVLWNLDELGLLEAVPA